MSRGWKVDKEVSTVDRWTYQYILGDNTRTALQTDVAIDGLTVVVKALGVAKTCIDTLGGLTVDQLRWIFSSYSVSQLEMTDWSRGALASGDGRTDNLWSSLHADCVGSEIMVN
jgi:ABC-type phosphate transport system substrate-binding protein